MGKPSMYKAPFFLKSLYHVPVYGAFILAPGLFIRSSDREVHRAAYLFVKEYVL